MAHTDHLLLHICWLRKKVSIFSFAALLDPYLLCTPGLLDAGLVSLLKCPARTSGFCAFIQVPRAQLGSYFSWLPMSLFSHPAKGPMEPVNRCECMFSCFSCVWLFETLWMVARQDALSMGFSRQESWIGLAFLFAGNLPDSGIEPVSLYVSCIGSWVLYHVYHRGSPSEQAVKRYLWAGGLSQF